MTYDFSQYHINLGDKDYPTKHNNAMDALETLGNDVISKEAAAAQSATDAQQYASQAAAAIPIIEGFVMTKSEFDQLRLNEIANYPVDGVDNVDFDTSFSFNQIAGWENIFKISAGKLRIDGVWHEHVETTITVPDAPNALQNKDLVTAGFTTLANAITAGGLGLTQSYLNQRCAVYAVQDDIVVPAPGALSNAYIQDTKNKIYSDDGVLRQRTMTFVVERLLESVVIEKADAWQSCVNAMTSLGWTQSTTIKGQWEKGGKKAIGMTVVQQRNQGAGHPLNTAGCLRVNAANTTSVFGVPWDHILAIQLNSISEAFNVIDATTSATEAAAASGGADYSGRWNGDGKYYDVILASDCQDLRVSSRRKPLAELNETYSAKALANTIRGGEGVPTSHFYTETQMDTLATQPAIFVVSGTTRYAVGDWVTIQDATQVLRVLLTSVTDGAISWDVAQGTINRVNAATLNVVVEKASTHTSAAPTWAGILGTPVAIAALLTTTGSKFFGADGIPGQWIGTILDGTTKNHPLNRKQSSMFLRLLTDDNGVSWSTSTFAASVTGPLNEWTAGSFGSGRVELWSYETQAHFTMPDPGVTRLTDWSPVTAINHADTAILASSLAGIVSVGSDPTETLGITKIVSDVISYTAETMTEDVKYSTAIGSYNGRLYLMFNCDDAGVIDSTNIKVAELPYFSDEV